MNRDDIIRMAREANLWMTSDERIAAVERFAALVAAHEREACALVCVIVEQKYYAKVKNWDDMSADDCMVSLRAQGAEKCAEVIRARGEEPKRHPGYIIGDHWLQAAYTRVCTGEDIRQVMEDYGYYP